MNITVKIGVGVCCLVPLFAGAQDKPVRYRSFFYNKALVHQVTVDLARAEVSPEVILKDRPTPLSGMFGEEKPVVALTGTFFNTSSAYPVADVVVEGRLMAMGSRGSMIGVDWYGNVRISDTPFQQAIDLSPYRFALRGTVRLIKAGVVAPNPKAQKFRDPSVWRRAPRCAAGLTHDGKLALFATKGSLYLSEIGKAMKAQGVTEAVCLDGGSSTTMTYRGATLIQPARRLSNLFVVYERSPFVAPTEKGFVSANW